MYEPSAIIGNEEIINKTVNKLIFLSIVPNFERKVFVCGAQELNLELRGVPALELFIALTVNYPAEKPLICLSPASASMPFYEEKQESILEKINGLWCEDTPMLYEMVCFIQD